MNLQEMVNKMQSTGYPIQDARAKVCQDIVLKAIADSSLSRNVTIKGGVVMRSITGNIRRSTRDLDIDFIYYSLSDEAINIFIKKINCLPDITIEQMFTEKLCSLLKFGAFSTRYKDIYDMYYQCNKINRDQLIVCLESYVFSDESMRENNMSDIVRRITKVFQNKSYRNKVDSSDKRWLDESIDEIFEKILNFLKSML